MIDDHIYIFDVLFTNLNISECDKSVLDPLKIFQLVFLIFLFIIH